MARINLGTSTSISPTGHTTQNKIVKTSGGDLVLFAYLGSGVGARIRYKISSDNGDTWSGSWIDIAFGQNLQEWFGNPTSYGMFDVGIDSNDDIHVIGYSSSAAKIYYEKLTYSAGPSWSNGTPVAILTAGQDRNTRLLVKANDDLWVFAPDSSYSNGEYIYSTDNGANWSTAASLGTVVYDAKFIEVGSDIWMIYQYSSFLKYKIYSGGSWGSANTIVASGITDGYIGVNKVSDSEIYVAARTTSGITVYKYTTSWDSGTLLSNNSSDSQPPISIVNSKPMVVWKDYDGSYYNIYYRYYNGSSWDAEVTLTSDNDIDNFPSVSLIDNNYVYICYTTGASSPYTIYFDKVSKNPPKQKIITSDAQIKLVGVKKTILSNAQITISKLKTILSNAQIKTVGTKKIIFSSAKIFGPTPIIMDINNKINTVIRNLSNINNKINTVFRTLSNINNVISFAKLLILDANNKINTQKNILHNLNNDIRFIKSWQIPGTAGIQSLGKTYITITIANILQSDVDVDSIIINKLKGQAFTASFDLGRTYDSTKPSLESEVIIKYSNWTLFKGYISSIIPTDSPESIRIECQNKYWLDNRTNVYFQVGHKPKDNQELYYETISDSIVAQYGFNPSFGVFTPITIDCFAQGKSDVLTRLCEESGNYGWFFDENENRVIWIAGEGSVIELNRQTLVENLHLYHVLEHNFSESSENIVNKLRVQMGETIVDKTDSGRTYTGYTYEKHSMFAYPAWNSAYELLKTQTGTGYGWDYPNPALADNYKDVFKKYSIPFLLPGSSVFADDKPVVVDVESPGWFYTVNIPESPITEGFTIDYENELIIFNEPKYCIQKNGYGETISVRAPLITVTLWRKYQYTVTYTPFDNPEITPGNPLMFITNKIGSYPTTVIKDLNLSFLTIKEGGTVGEVVVSGWDDTKFAEDYAHWQLSKTSEKEIRGTIKITLDAACFYNLDLVKRIFIEGITDSPMNIISISYNISNFSANIELENNIKYTRTVSLPSRGI